MPLDATPGGVSSNSYVTVSEAVSYLSSQRGYADCFLNLDGTSQETFLIWATEIIGACFDFSGYLSTNYQNLRWPRVGVLDEDFRYVSQNQIPARIAHATAILALELAKRDRSEVPDIISQGTRSTGVGPLRADIDPNAVLPLVPNHVIAMMSVYGRVKSTGLTPSAGRVIKAWRA